MALIPLLTTLLVAEFRTKNLTTQLDPVRDTQFETEKRIGTYRNYLGREGHKQWGYTAKAEEVWNREGFDDAAGVLTSLAASCAFIESKCLMYMNLLDWFQKKVEGEGGESNKWQRSAQAVCNLKIGFLRCGLENDRLRAIHLGERAKVQVQAVSTTH